MIPDRYKNILKRFPLFELPYEQMTHKQVHGDTYCAIPKGIKSFLWFTYFKNKNTCFVIDINYKNGSIKNIYEHTTCFSDKCALGTVLYGTMVKNNNINYFVANDIFYFLGKDISNFNFSLKLNIFNILFSNHIKQTIYNNKHLVVTLSIIHTNYDEFINMIKFIPYNLYCIQIKNLFGETVYTNTMYKPPIKQNAIFLVKPTIYNDIYELFYNDNGDKMYDIAYIPSYNTSVMLNNIFRNIKENINLDSLEESDDEDEFQNINEDKFVFMDRQHKMLCEYSNKFKRWIPLNIVDDNNNIITKNDLSYLQNNI